MIYNTTMGLHHKQPTRGIAPAQPAGEVKLKLRQINPGIGIEVTDTGIGIAEDQIANIFESFTQASVGQQS